MPSRPRLHAILLPVTGASPENRTAVGATGPPCARGPGETPGGFPRAPGRRVGPASARLPRTRGLRLADTHGVWTAMSPPHRLPALRPVAPLVKQAQISPATKSQAERARRTRWRRSAVPVAARGWGEGLRPSPAGGWGPPARARGPQPLPLASRVSASARATLGGCGQQNHGPQRDPRPHARSGRMDQFA